MSDRGKASSPNSAVYTVEKIVDHARFDDLYFRKLMYLKNHHPATDQIMGSFVAQYKKGERCSKYVYRTRWAGYRPDEDTWEPEANFWIPDSNGKFVANGNLVTYKEPLRLKGYQLIDPKFTSQTNAENLKKFALPAKIYEDLNMRFEIWANKKNKSSLNANILQKPQMPSKFGEHEKAQPKKKRSHLEMDSNESGSSAASCLNKLRAQRAQASANALQEAYERVNSYFLSKPTEQWVKKKKEDDSWRRLFVAINDSSSSDDEQPPSRRPLKRNTRKEPQSTSSSSSDKNEDESSQSSDSQPFYIEIPAAETYAIMKADERKKKQRELNRIYKNVNDEGIRSGEEMEIDTNSEAQQKKNLLVAFEDSVIEPLRKDPIKLKIRIDPLGKVVTCRPVDTAQKQTVEIRSKKPLVQNEPQQQILDSLLRDVEIATKAPHFKKQRPPRLPQKTVEAENIINIVPKALQEENDILIIEEKPCEENNFRNKKSQVAIGYFEYSMTPFFAMPYQRPRARSCGAAMTDGGVSFMKELEESDAKERRWNALLKRGVRIDSTEQVYRIGKQIRLTQIRRDGVVRYACAEKSARDYLRKIGHSFSKPVPLREIDIDLVEKNEKNEANRKKKNVAEK